MATIKVCDLCNKHPNDYDAASGGDVRRVTLDIQSDNTSNSVEQRTFDACATCRTRLLGDVLEQVSARPPKVAEAVESSDYLQALREVAEEYEKARTQPKRGIPAIPMPSYPTYPSWPRIIWGDVPPFDRWTVRG